MIERQGAMNRRIDRSRSVDDKIIANQAVKGLGSPCHVFFFFEYPRVRRTSGQPPKTVVDMGQRVGRLPDTWQDLIEEKERVLRWSAEVLARVDDNIENEDTFLMDYDNVKIDNKVERWMTNRKHKWEVALSRFPDAPESSRNDVKIQVTRIADDTRNNMRAEYQKAYGRMKNFTNKVDALGIDERRIHTEIQSLETICANDRKKFVKKFGPLRNRVFKNLHTGEKMLFEEKKLKTAFAKKVYDIDHKCMADCAKRIDKLVEDFEKIADVTR